MYTPRAFAVPDVEPQTAPDSGNASGIAAAGAEPAGIESRPDTDKVYAEAEEDPEDYDANTDPYLMQEQF